MKTCSKCKTEKELTEFHKDKTRKDGHYSWCKACYSAKAKQWYADNPERAAAPHAAWAKANPEKKAYCVQKAAAKYRGVPWEYTFESWLQWWGGDFALRGGGEHDLCMARYNDEGPYCPDNCYKATMLENRLGCRTNEVN